MATEKGTPPDYHFHALDKNTEDRKRVGAAWKQPDGSISIALDAFIVLQGGAKLMLRLFPNDDEEKFRK